VGLFNSFSSENSSNWDFVEDASVVDDAGVIDNEVVDLLVVVMEDADVVVVLVVDVKVEVVVKY